MSPLLTLAGMIGGARRGLRALWGLVTRYPLLAVCIALSVSSGWFWHQDGKHIRERDAERVAHAGTVAEYRAAAAQAQAAARANILRVRTEQAAITERVEDDYQDHAADTDARYRRLLADAQARDGRAGDAGMPAAGDTPCFADGTPCTPDILAILRDAEANTNQLIGLQDWARFQAGVHNN